MLVASTVLAPIVSNDLETIQNTQPYVYNWIVDSARRIGMRPKKLQVLLLDLFQKRYFEYDLLSIKNRIVRS